MRVNGKFFKKIFKWTLLPSVSHTYHIVPAPFPPRRESFSLRRNVSRCDILRNPEQILLHSM